LTHFQLFHVYVFLQWTREGMATLAALNVLVHVSSCWSYFYGKWKF